MQSKARRNQLNLPHGTKTKPDMQKMVSSQSPLCQSGRNREDLWWEGFVKEVGYKPHAPSDRHTIRARINVEKICKIKHNFDHKSFTYCCEDLFM